MVMTGLSDNKSTILNMNKSILLRLEQNWINVNMILWFESVIYIQLITEILTSVYYFYKFIINSNYIINCCLTYLGWIITTWLPLIYHGNH